MIRRILFLAIFLVTSFSSFHQESISVVAELFSDQLKWKVLYNSKGYRCLGRTDSSTENTVTSHLNINKKITEDNHQILVNSHVMSSKSLEGLQSLWDNIRRI